MKMTETDHKIISELKKDPQFAKNLIKLPYELNIKYFMLIHKDLIPEFHKEIELIRDLTAQRINNIEHLFLRRTIWKIVNEELDRFEKELIAERLRREEDEEEEEEEEEEDEKEDNDV